MIFGVVPEIPKSPAIVPPAVDKAPNLVKAASAVVAPVPPCAIGNVPNLAAPFSEVAKKAPSLVFV